MENQKGFTIIELIIVVSIITVLLSILIPAGSQARERARIAKSQSQVSALELAITAFQSDFGFYPTKQSGGTVETNNAHIVELLTGFTFNGTSKSASSDSRVTNATWNGPYLEIDITDTNASGQIVDPWGTPYTFSLALDDNPATPPSNNIYTFDIIGAGPDATSGTADDLKNF